jgi:peptide/nickel transport system substrate-binding protein
MVTTLVALVTCLALTIVPLTTAAQETPRMGGVLKAAMIGESPTLDVHTTTATISYQIMWHVYESLYTLDRNQEPTPMLAEGHTVSHEGRRYTIALRRGVKFHNGKELTSADVVASLTRWGKLWCPEEKDRLMAELGRESDPKRRKAIIERVQAIFYDDVAKIKFGDAFIFHVARKELRGDFRTAPYLYFWNAWLQ